jgi:hypothetical protein
MDFPEVAFLQTDDAENWKRKLGQMSIAELQRCQERLTHALDRPVNASAPPSAIANRKRLEHALELCNEESIRRVSAPDENATRNLLVLAEGHYPSFDVTEQSTFGGAQTIAEVPCPFCKRTFAVYSKENVPEDELSHCIESAKKQTEQELLNHHSHTSPHPNGIWIAVPRKKKK